MGTAAASTASRRRSASTPLRASLRSAIALSRASASSREPSVGAWRLYQKPYRRAARRRPLAIARFGTPVCCSAIPFGTIVTPQWVPCLLLGRDFDFIPMRTAHVDHRLIRAGTLVAQPRSTRAKCVVLVSFIQGERRPVRAIMRALRKGAVSISTDRKDRDYERPRSPSSSDNMPLIAPMKAPSS